MLNRQRKQCRIVAVNNPLLRTCLGLFPGVKNPVYQHSLKMAGRGRGMTRK